MAKAMKISRIDIHGTGTQHKVQKKIMRCQDKTKQASAKHKTEECNESKQECSMKTKQGES